MRGRSSVAALSRSRAYGDANPLDDDPVVVLNVVIREAHHAKALRGQPGVPFGIPLRHAGGRIATYQYHSPFRRYYVARNNIDLMLRNIRTRPRWVATVAKPEASGMITSIVSGPQRLAQFLAITTGTLHGLIRRRGMIPAWLKRLVS